MLVKTLNHVAMQLFFFVSSVVVVTYFLKPYVTL